MVRTQALHAVRHLHGLPNGCSNEAVGATRVVSKILDRP